MPHLSSPVGGGAVDPPSRQGRQGRAAVAAAGPSITVTVSHRSARLSHCLQVSHLHNTTQTEDFSEVPHLSLSLPVSLSRRGGTPVSAAALLSHGE